jgi:hypothetical protein
MESQAVPGVNPGEKNSGLPVPRMLRRELPDRGENRDPGVATEVSYKS